MQLAISKANRKQGITIFPDIASYVNINIDLYKWNENQMEKKASTMQNLQVNCWLKLFKKMTNIHIQEERDYIMAPNTSPIINCKAWSSPVKYGIFQVGYFSKVELQIWCIF